MAPTKVGILGCLKLFSLFTTLSSPVKGSYNKNPPFWWITVNKKTYPIFSITFPYFPYFLNNAISYISLLL